MSNAKDEKDEHPNSEKKIYRDFDHWWQEGQHGYTSASREHARELWDDLEPTIQASRDDYKNAYVALMNEVKEWRSDILDAAIDYAKEFGRPEAPKFWRWFLDRESEKTEAPPILEPVKCSICKNKAVKVNEKFKLHYGEADHYYYCKTCELSWGWDPQS